MIWVKYQTREDAFVSLEITGHADFREKGEDVVCAAASLTGTGLLNAIDEMEPEVMERLKELEEDAQSGAEEDYSEEELQAAAEELARREKEADSL